MLSGPTALAPIDERRIPGPPLRADIRDDEEFAENEPHQPSPLRQRLRANTYTVAGIVALADPEPLIEGWMTAGSLNVLYAAPKSGKSLLALDWSAHVVLGRPWCGHPVTAGPVVYIAAEGRSGLSQRVRAWCTFNGREPDDLNDLRFVTMPVALLGTATAIETADHIKAICEPSAATLIVVDTLARCFGGGDENATKDMTEFVASLDRIRLDTGAAVLVIHHAGKDETRGPAGPSRCSAQSIASSGCRARNAR